jgi:hypothetical protein
VAKVSALPLALATRAKRLVSASCEQRQPPVFEEPNDDRDTAQDRAGIGRIL